MLPSGVVRAGLVALSRYQIFRRYREQFPAASSRCRASLAVLYITGGSPPRIPATAGGGASRAATVFGGAGFGPETKVRLERFCSVKPAAGTAADLPVYPSLDAEAESAPRWTA